MKKKIFLITNQGLHPVEKKLKKTFGDDIVVKQITKGNLPYSLKYGSVIAKEVRNWIFEIEDGDIYIVWSGLGIYNSIVYQVIYQTLSKRPIFVLFNKETDSYEEWDIDPRKLIFN